MLVWQSMHTQTFWWARLYTASMEPPQIGQMSITSHGPGLYRVIALKRVLHGTNAIGKATCCGAVEAACLPERVCSFGHERHTG